MSLEDRLYDRFAMVFLAEMAGVRHRVEGRARNLGGPRRTPGRSEDRVPVSEDEVRRLVPAFQRLEASLLIYGVAGLRLSERNAPGEAPGSGLGAAGVASSPRSVGRT